MAFTLQPITPNIVKMEFIGDFTDDDADNQSAGIDHYMSQMAVGTQMNFLIDTSRMGKISAKARRVFTERNKNPQVGSTAVYGVSRTLKVLGVFIIKASGRDNIRFFDTESDGLAWLKQEVEKHA
jgi:hypothetical protein